MRLRYRLRELRYAIHPGIWYGLRNLWYYLPAIWNDRDWDWTYMVAIWEKKFAKVAAHEERFGNHTNSKRDAADLRVCAALCRRIQGGEYDYIESMLERHKQKWGEMDFAVREDGAFGYRRQQSEVERKEHLRICKHGDQQLKDDIAYLCRIIQKRLRCWWN